VLRRSACLGVGYGTGHLQDVYLRQKPAPFEVGDPITAALFRCEPLDPSSISAGASGAGTRVWEWGVDDGWLREMGQDVRTEGFAYQHCGYACI
jgi:hypothetical protein